MYKSTHNNDQNSFLDPADRAAWFHALVEAFFTEPPPMPPLGPDGLPTLPRAQPAYHSDFIKVCGWMGWKGVGGFVRLYVYQPQPSTNTTQQVFDRSGDMKLVMARFARVATTAGGLGLVAPGCPGYDITASCLVIRMESVPSTR